MNRLHHDPADDLNLVIVTHGLASRVFLMKWFKWTVEQFEYLNNPGNAEFRVMQLGLGGEYSLAIHHTEDEMLEWGLSPEMIADQKWRAHACRSSWSDKCTWYIDSFFDNLAEDSAEESDHSEEESYDRLEQINHFAEESNHSAEESTHGEEESTHGEEESNHGAEESNQCEEELDDNEEGSNKSAEDSNHSVEDPEDIAEEQEPAECEANDCE